MKKDFDYIHVYLAIYRCSVLITWVKDIKSIDKIAKIGGIKLSEEWLKKSEEHHKGNLGTCETLGEDNNDVLIWLKDKPVTMEKLEILYHEIYHAVGFIAERKGMEKEEEARAYLFEYIVHECNKVLCKKRK